MNSVGRTSLPELAEPVDEVPAADIVKTASRNKTLLLVSAIAGGLMGFFLASQIEPMYAAGSTLIADARLGSIYDIDQGTEAAIIDPSTTATVVETIGTQAVVRRTIAALPPEMRKLLETEARVDEQIVELGVMDTHEYRERILLIHVADRLEVSNSGRSYAIQIYFTSGSAELSAAVANAAANVFTSYRAELRRQDYQVLLDGINAEIEELQVEMTTADRNSQVLRERVELLESQSGSLTGQQRELAIETSANLFASLRAAERDADATSDLYEQLLRLRRVLQASLDAPALDVKVFSPASPPLEPTGANIEMALIGLGAFAGVGIMLSFLVYWRSRRSN